MASLLQIFGKICSIEAPLWGASPSSQPERAHSHAQSVLMASDST